MQEFLTPDELLLETWDLNNHRRPHADADDEDDQDKKQRYYCETAVMTDWHLGTQGCKALAILQFLKYVRCEELILAGDIVDFLMLKVRPYFPEDHLTVIKKLLKRAHKGMKITIVPGNHDQVVRDCVYFLLLHNIILSLGDNIRFVPAHVIHSRGKKCLIIHGDEGDELGTFSKFWQTVGGHALDIAVWLDGPINTVLRLLGVLRVLGIKEWPFSALCKRLSKRLIEKFSRSFNEAMAAEGKKRGAKVVIHGHTHIVADVMIDGVQVMDAGSWVDNPPIGCTAVMRSKNDVLGLVQLKDGKLYNLKTGEPIPFGDVYFADPAPAAPEAEPAIALCA